MFSGANISVSKQSIYIHALLTRHNHVDICIWKLYYVVYYQITQVLI